MKKVLYISYDGLTDPLGQSQVLPYLIELARSGYSFTILSFEKKDRFEREAGIIQSLIKGERIKWVPLTFTSRPPVLSKIYDRYRMWHTALTLHKENKFDIVHCRSYVAAEMGLRLKSRFGTKFLFDMRGFWANEKVDNGQWDIRRPFYKKIYNHYKKKEKEFLLNADSIVSLTEAARQYLLQQKQYSKLAIEVIPCCADLEHFDYHKIDEGKIKQLRERLGFSDNVKVITYLGSIGGWYMTREMFSFFRLLLEKDNSYHMLLLTKDNPEKVKMEAESFGIPADKVTVTYSQRDSLPFYLALSRYSIFFIRNSFSKIASSPTKHAELMGMGIPVICNDIGDTGNIISQTGTGLIINEFDEKTLHQAICNIEDLQAIPKDKIREAAREIFDLKIGASRYLKIYQQLTVASAKSVLN